MDSNYNSFLSPHLTGLPHQIFGFTNPLQLSEPIPSDESLSLYIHILLVLFLWRMLTNTASNSVPFGLLLILIYLININKV